jgi:cytochrome c peroxidase
MAAENPHDQLTEQTVVLEEMIITCTNRKFISTDNLLILLLSKLLRRTNLSKSQGKIKMKISPITKNKIVLIILGLMSGSVIAQDVNQTSPGSLITLGQAIFFDKNLSKPEGQSCSSCHNPATGFADPNSELPVSRGAIENLFGNRNAPSAAYAMFSPKLHQETNKMGEMMYVGGLFWDGRGNNLEDQAKQPLLNNLEMHNPNKQSVINAVHQSDYAHLFKTIFGETSLQNVDTAYEALSQALAAYERSPKVNRFTSKYDYWKKGAAQLSESEQRGFKLFTDTTTTDAKCVNCHAVSANESVSPSLFTNFSHHNLGVPRNPELPYYSLPTSLNPDGQNYVDYGLGDFLRSLGYKEEQATLEDGKFKVPSLRNCAITAPYEHNGVFKTLREVVMFNSTRDVPGAGWPAPEVPENIHRHIPPMPRTFGQLGLTDQEVDDIVAFLETLTDDYKPKLKDKSPRN